MPLPAPSAGTMSMSHCTWGNSESHLRSSCVSGKPLLTQLFLESLLSLLIRTQRKSDGRAEKYKHRGREKTSDRSREGFVLYTNKTMVSPCHYRSAINPEIFSGLKGDRRFLLLLIFIFCCLNVCQLLDLMVDLLYNNNLNNLPRLYLCCFTFP